jgi:ribonuclease HI
MSKKKYLKFLNELFGAFSNNEKVQDLIVELKEEVQKSELKESKTAQMDLNSADLPLPSEIVDDGKHFALFSDGACRGNPGPGAWGALGQDSKGEVLFESSGVEMHTTNNIMELQGAIEALHSIENYFAGNGDSQTGMSIFLYSDSKYVVDGITKWVSGWKARGWKKADNKAPENLKLWQEFDVVASKFSNLHFKWVKGHAGHPQNERVDQLANLALDESGL